MLMRLVHDDVIKWKHFPRYWPFVRGIHRSPVNSPHKGQWRGALMFSLNCIWINSWINNREAGDLRRDRAHYDVIVMINHKEFAWFHLMVFFRLRIPDTFKHHFYLTLLYYFQFFNDTGRQSLFRTRIRKHFREMWNILDMLAQFVFLMGLVLRFIPDNPDCFKAARVMWALSLIMFWCRLLQSFTIDRNLGPKLVMIGRMVRMSVQQGKHVSPR